MSAPTLTKNVLIGTAGEYYVCAELLSRGILAVPAPKNTPQVDLLASSLDGTRFANIQVKCTSYDNTQGWKLNRSIEDTVESQRFFVVLVNLTEAGKLPDFYIFAHDELADMVKSIFVTYMQNPKKSGEPKKDPGFRWMDFRDYPEKLAAHLNKWELLGLW